MDLSCFVVFFTFVNAYFMPKHNARIQLLTFQIKMLRKRVEALRITPTPDERAELERLGAACGSDVGELIFVVKVQTYRRWLGKTAKKKTGKSAGRPQTDPEIVKLIVAMAEKNISWGYKRIWGEIKKLGLRVGLTTVRQILKREEVPVPPERSKERPGMPWGDFIKAHMDTLVAIDFFSKPVYNLFGVHDAYILVFIHLRSRQVYTSYPTYNPDEQWVLQQARNATFWFEDIGIKVRFLIHDRDTKFTTKFKQFWKDAQVRCIPIPPSSPRANSFVEAYIGTIKTQCLNKFICLSLEHLDHILRTWSDYYHTQRPHQGKDIGNNVLRPNFTPTTGTRIVHKTALGGVLSWYEREAA